MRSGGGLLLSWSAEAPRAFVEVSGDLADWEPLGITPTQQGGTMYVLDAITGNVRRFYRLLPLPRWPGA